MTKKQKLLSRICCGSWSCVLCFALRRLTAAIGCMQAGLFCRRGQHFDCHVQSSVVWSVVLKYISFRLQLFLHEELGKNCQEKWYPVGQQVNGRCWWNAIQRCMCCNCLLFFSSFFLPLFFFLNAMVGRVGIINVFSVWQPLIRQEERINSGMFPLLLSRRYCWQLFLVAQNLLTVEALL